MQLIKEAKRIVLSQSHFAYLQRYHRSNRFLWGWRRTEAMIASKVFAEDGTPEVIVTTLLIDGRIRHAEEVI